MDHNIQVLVIYKTIRLSKESRVKQLYQEVLVVQRNKALSKDIKRLKLV